MRNPRNERLGAQSPSRLREGPGQGLSKASPIPDIPSRDGSHAPPVTLSRKREGSERRCILTGERDDREALIRLALSPDGEVLPDALAKAPGRGAWLGVDRAALDRAVAKGKLRGALARAFKGAPLSIPADLGARIEAALTRAMTDRLGLELRAGRLLLGSERIERAAREARVAWLGHARDAGEDGNRRLDQAWRVGRGLEGTGAAGDILPLDRAALSVALGRDNVVHLALTDSAAAQRLTAVLSRLMRFLGRDPGPGDRPAAEATHDTAAVRPDATI